MSNLRNRLATRAEVKTVTVEDAYEGDVPSLDKDGKPRFDKDGKALTKKGQITETYVLKGLPDDYSLTIGLMGDQEQQKQANLYTAHMRERWKDKPGDCPAPFAKEDVYKVKLVAHYLQPEPVADDAGKPVMKDGQPTYHPPLSEYEIAFMSKEMGPLFIKLFAQAVMIANNRAGAKVGDQEIEDPTITVGLGNSEGATTEP